MRIKALGVIIFTLISFLIAGLFYIQIIKGPFYKRLASQNRIRLVSIESPRGRIFDTNGALLVDNEISFDVAIIPQELHNKERMLKSLSEKLKIPEGYLRESLKNNFITPFQPVKIISNIGKKMAITLEEERLDLPGVIIETAPRRNYVHNETAAHVLGYLGQINTEELTRLKSYGYRMDDLIGREGIEKYYDNYLRGTRGGMQVEVDNMGYQVRILGIKEPSKGKDIYLTLDIRLQKFIEGLFENTRGAICVIDPRNGKILSLVSSPSFDPNLFTNKKDISKIKELFTRDDYPMLNRLIHCSYPPGSVFKIVTASAALERSKISPRTTFSCSGSYALGNKVFKCWRTKGHGEQTMREAIKNSCNVFFYQVGRITGAENIAEYATKYGFGVPTGIDIYGEISGLVPNKMWKALNKREPWYEGETLNYAIGQGYLLVTPLQVLQMISAVANGEYLVTPYLVKRIEDVDISQAEKRRIGISSEALNVIKDGLVKVVNDPDGTGNKAALEDLRVAGKTGTAQTSTDKTHAWFVGYAPAEDPKAALVVFLEYGGKGGLGATSTGGRIFKELKNLGYL